MKRIKSSPGYTTSLVEAADTRGMKPEFIRIEDVRRLFGIRRGCTYALLKTGRIRGCLLRVKGKKSGVRLIETASVSEYVRSQMAKEEFEVSE